MKAAQQMQASGTRPTAAQIQAMQVGVTLAASVCRTPSQLTTSIAPSRFTLQKAMPPDLLRKLRAAGPSGAQKVMEEAMRGGNPPPGMDMGAMMRAMTGGAEGGMPGMPGMSDMSSLMNMMGGG